MLISEPPSRRKPRGEALRYIAFAGFILQFREVARDHHEKAKGNVDVDLTLHAVDVNSDYDKAVIVTSEAISHRSLRTCSEEASCTGC
jgi:hypothetical protein